MRGLNTLRMFKGQYSEDADVRSYCAYLLTDKELFEAKLRGYYDTEDVNLAEKGFSDPWMLKKSTMKQLFVLTD